jgi:homoserine kinase
MRRGSSVPQGRVARAIVPASTANLGPGFDSLGMALPIFSGIAMRQAANTRIHLIGGQLDGIAQDKTNLVYEAAQAVFHKAGIEIPELEIGIQSDIPLTRGLGSSAAAIVGALVAANGLIGSVLPSDELFQMATAMERHPDNVGAAFFGGFVAAAWDGERAEAVKLDPPADLDVLVAIPDFELPTKEARNVLPQQVTMQDAVFNLSHSSLLTAALAAGRLDLLRHAMRDRLHQPYRAALVPGMETVLRDAPNHGALGAVLSGAGPTLLLLADQTDPKRGELEGYVKSVMVAEGIQVSMRWLKPCLFGASCYVQEAYQGEMDPPLTSAVPVQPEVRA